MVSSELSDQKPGIITAFRVLVTFLSVGAIVAVILYATRGTNKYDSDRAAKRYANLKKLNEDILKKATEYAVLDQAKGTFQLPLAQAITLTAKELSAIQPRAAYPIATPAAPVADPTAAPGTPTTTAVAPAAPAPAVVPAPTIAPSATPLANP